MSSVENMFLRLLQQQQQQRQDQERCLQAHIDDMMQPQWDSRALAAVREANGQETAIAAEAPGEGMDVATGTEGEVAAAAGGGGVRAASEADSLTAAAVAAATVAAAAARRPVWGEKAGDKPVRRVPGTRAPRKGFAGGDCAICMHTMDPRKHKLSRGKNCSKDVCVVHVECLNTWRKSGAPTARKCPFCRTNMF